ncbi:MAG TPA: peptide chain release factor N(5)-glutamine methyltransferase [Burkholderiales bacterium]|nr:peptide chain release factor N(5)-glutamine methyltransferase [Burkholderiales bacterium]
MTIRQALAASGLERREARLLLAEAAGMSPARVIAFAEEILSPESRARFDAFCARRRAGEPIAYILGRQEFYGLEFSIDPAVLIPRPETELLVELALQKGFGSLVDLGTGCGAIAIAAKKHRPGARVVAVEASAAALAVARRNAASLEAGIDFRHGRWCEPLAGESFDLIAANPPYVAAADPHLLDLGFEPRGALVAGEDGLEAIRVIAQSAPPHLLPGGWLLLEHGLGQDAQVRTLLEAAGLGEVASWPDLGGIPRVSGGKR